MCKTKSLFTLLNCMSHRRNSPFGLPVWYYIRSNAAWLNPWKIITITVRPLQLSAALSVQKPIDRHLRAFHLAGDQWSWTPWPLATCWPWNDGRWSKVYVTFDELMMLFWVQPLNETWKSMNRAVCVYREIQKHYICMCTAGFWRTYGIMEKLQRSDKNNPNNSINAHKVKNQNQAT